MASKNIFISHLVWSLGFEHAFYNSLTFNIVYIDILTTILYWKDKILIFHQNVIGYVIKEKSFGSTSSRSAQSFFYVNASFLSS